MAENNYPQLPTTVWRGVREMLRKSAKRKLDEKILAVELSVQQTAAKAYLNQLVGLGLLKDDGTPTALADKWRQDNPAPAVEEILSKVYPKALLDLAPSENLNRAKIVSWFMSEGLGSGTAGNKAATYIMIAQSAFGEEINANANTTTRPRATSKVTSKKQPATRKNIEKLSDNKGADPNVRQKKPDLNINIQIHISADASSEQIDSIFSSMKRYFNESD